MKLQKEFMGRGDSKNCQFSQIKRVGDLAIYSRTNIREEVSYEVIKITRQAKDWVINGEVVVPTGQEKYPSSSSWGSAGWTCATLAKAENKLKELIQKNVSQNH